MTQQRETSNSTPPTGSDVCDAFLAALAAQQSVEGIADAVHRVAERVNDPDADDSVEVRRVWVLAERAAFSWAARTLEVEGRPHFAEGLQSLKPAGQASYVAEQLRQSYASALPPHVDATLTCTYAAGALLMAIDLDEHSPVFMVQEAAHPAAKSLAALARADAAMDVVEEAQATVMVLLEQPEILLTYE